MIEPANEGLVEVNILLEIERAKFVVVRHKAVVPRFGSAPVADVFSPPTNLAGWKALAAEGRADFD